MRSMTVNKCPVCGMDAEHSKICADHIGIKYRFCSQQCRENFLARPTLYVGRQAAKLAGKVVIKRRTFLLDHAVGEAMEYQLNDALRQMMGVRDVRVNGREISVTYDLLEDTAEQVEQALADAGAAFGSGWAERLKRGWVHYTEETELDNLAAGDAACCNKPPAKG